MRKQTIYFTDDYEWAISRQTDFVAIQPAPLAVTEDDGKSFDGLWAILKSVGLKRHYAGVEPPTAQGVCLSLPTDRKARVEITGVDGVVDGWNVPHGDNGWSEAVRSEGMVLLLVTQNAIDPKAQNGRVITKARLDADIESGGVLSAIIRVCS